MRVVGNLYDNDTVSYDISVKKNKNIFYLMILKYLNYICTKNELLSEEGTKNSRWLRFFKKESEDVKMATR